MRQAGEVTYAGMCQSIYQQFEFKKKRVVNAKHSSFPDAHKQNRNEG